MFVARQLGCASFAESRRVAEPVFRIRGIPEEEPLTRRTRDLNGRNQRPRSRLGVTQGEERMGLDAAQRALQRSLPSFSRSTFSRFPPRFRFAVSSSLAAVVEDARVL